MGKPGKLAIADAMARESFTKGRTAA